VVRILHFQNLWFEATLRNSYKIPKGSNPSQAITQKEGRNTVESDEAFTEYAAIVSDGEQEIRTAFSDGKRHFQKDLIHAFWVLGFKLWKISG